MSNATIDFQNPISFGSSDRTIDVNDGTAAVDARLSGVLSGTGGLYESVFGTLELTAANTYTGQTSIWAGALRLSNPLALPGGCGATGGTSNLNFYGGVLELASGDFYRGLGTGSSQVQFSALDGGFAAVGGNRVVNLGGNSTPLSWGQGSFSPWIFVLGSPNADATVDFQNPINLQYQETIRVDNGSAAIDGKLSGALSGSGDLRKTGDGTLQLTAQNTLSGNTSLLAGTLLVDGTLPSNVTVSGGATLGGTGTVGQVTVNLGGHIAPGDSIGVLTLGSDLTLASGALLDFDLHTVAASDEIDMSASTLYLNGQQFSDFDFNTLAGFGQGTYILIDAGTIAGSLGNDCSGTIGGLQATLCTSGNDLLLTVVPEPSALVLAVAGILGLLVLLRRRI